MVPDAQSLIALLGGTDRLIINFKLRPDHDVAHYTRVFRAAMGAAELTAELPVISEAITLVRHRVARPPSARDLRLAGAALIAAPHPAHDLFAVGREAAGNEAVNLVALSRDPLAAVAALAQGIDPHGSYAVRRLRRAA